MIVARVINSVETPRAGNGFVYSRDGTTMVRVFSAEDKAFIQSKIDQALRERQYAPGDPKHLYAEAISITPEQMNHPLRETFEYRKGANNSPFEARKRKGEIVVSPLEVYKAVAVYTPGRKVINVAWASAIDIYLWQLTSVFNVVSVNAAARGEHIVLQDGCIFRGFCTAFRTTESYYQNVHPFDVGWSSEASLSSVKNSLQFLDIDNVLVQKVLADANTGALDVLTAVAELPETVESIANGLRAVARFTSELKRKEVALTKSHLIARKRIDKRIARLRRNNAKNRDLIVQQEKAARKEYAKIEQQLVTETASLWMWYRYEVMPNAYLIEDAIAYFRDIIRSFEKYRDRRRFSEQSFNHFIDGWLSEFNISYDVRCWIKRSYSLGMNFTEQVYKHMGTSALVTAFELVKRSFVLDWFLTIGDFLRAIVFDYSIVDQQAASYSQKCDSVIDHFHEASKASVKIYVDGYERKIINPCDFTGIYVDIGYDLIRQLDTFAMLWPAIKKQLSEYQLSKKESK